MGGGCDVEGEAPRGDPLDGGGVARVAGTARDCAGNVLAPCPPGRVGPGCALVCDPTVAACDFSLYCHGDGRPAGVLGLGATVLELAPDEDPAAALAAWAAGHPAAVGLSGTVDAGALDLRTIDSGSQGALVVHRIEQRYRGHRILGPEATLTLSGPAGRMVSLRGTVVDPRPDYDGLADTAPEGAARAAIQGHAERQTGVPADQVQVQDLHLAAMPGAARMVWVGRAVVGLRPLGRYAVAAAGDGTGGGLPLVWFDDEVHAGLEDTAPITVLGEDPASDPLADPVETAPVGTLLTGAPLLGSLEDESGELQLGDPRLFVHDLAGGDDVTSLERFTSPDGQFLATEGVAAAAQRAYQVLQSFYDVADRSLQEPQAPGPLRWDSLLGADSAYPPGTFRPRVGVLFNVVFGPPQPAFVNTLVVSDSAPEYVQHWPEADPTAKSETLGGIYIRGDDLSTPVLAHEFGHVVDLFLGGGFTASPPCPQDGCVAKCVEDTSDEAAPLAETVANLLEVSLLAEAFEAVTSDACSLLAVASRNPAKAPVPGACMDPDGDRAALLLRDADCPMGVDDGWCDKPEAAGFWYMCCDPDLDPDCTIDAPDCGPTCCADPAGPDCEPDPACPSGASRPGKRRALPTGACNASAGYRVNSALQAWWQLVFGQVCDPYTCAPLVLPPGVAPADAAHRALFYALRLGAASYRQLFDYVALYYACNYGPSAYEGVRSVLCLHEIMACDAPMPVTCQTCGNGVVEGDEPCDGLELTATCEDLGYLGGALACTADCTFDESGCEAGTTGGASDGGDGGCGCRAGGGGGPVAGVSFLLAALGWRRRRLGAAAVAASLACLLLSAVGCGPRAETGQGMSGGEDAGGGPDAGSGGDPDRWAPWYGGWHEWDTHDDIGVVLGGMSFGEGRLVRNACFQAGGRLWMEVQRCQRLLPNDPEQGPLFQYWEEYRWWIGPEGYPRLELVAASEDPPRDEAWFFPSWENLELRPGPSGEEMAFWQNPYEDGEAQAVTPRYERKKLCIISCPGWGEPVGEVPIDAGLIDYCAETPYTIVRPSQIPCE